MVKWKGSGYACQTEKMIKIRVFINKKSYDFYITKAELKSLLNGKKEYIKIYRMVEEGK